MPELSQQSPAAVPGAQELAASEGVRNAEVQGNVHSPSTSTPSPTGEAAPSATQGTPSEVPQEVALINEMTGRNYKTLDEARKGVKETFSYVGTLGQRASIADKIAEKVAAENGVSKEAAIEYLRVIAEAEQGQATPEAQAQGNPAQQSNERVDVPAPGHSAPRTPQDFETQRLAEQVQALTFLRKYPDAEAHLETVKLMSRATGEDYTVAFESRVLPLLTLGKKAAYEVQEAKSTGEAVVSQTAAPEVDHSQEIFQAWANNPKGNVSLMDVLRAKGMTIKASEE